MVVEHRPDRPDGDASIGEGSLQADYEHREALRLVLELLIRRRARQKQEEVGVLRPRDEDLLAVDDVATTFLHGGGAQSRGLRSRFGLRDPERLQPRLTLRERRQVLALLLFAAVLEKCAHRVHLRVGTRRVAARSVDLFEDDRRVRDFEARPAVLGRDERREPPCFRERIDELLRVLALAIDLTPVDVPEVGAELPHGGADVLAIGIVREVHLSPGATGARGGLRRRASEP